MWGKNKVAIGIALFLLINQMNESIKGNHIHNPAVNVTKLLQAEQPRPVSRVIEREALYDQLVAILSNARYSRRDTVVA